MSTPAHKTIAVLVTLDGDTILVSAPKSGPRVLNEVTAHAQLRDLVLDPTVPAAKVEAAGFDMGDFMRGIGRTIAELGREDPKAGGQ